MWITKIYYLSLITTSPSFKPSSSSSSFSPLSFLQILSAKTKPPMANSFKKAMLRKKVGNEMKMKIKRETTSTSDEKFLSERDFEIIYPSHNQNSEIFHQSLSPPQKALMKISEGVLTSNLAESTITGAGMLLRSEKPSFEDPLLAELRIHRDYLVNHANELEALCGSHGGGGGEGGGNENGHGEVEEVEIDVPEIPPPEFPPLGSNWWEPYL